MRWIRRAVRVADGDAFQASLFGALVLALDLWLLSRTEYDPTAVAALVGLDSAGALAGLGIGMVGARVDAHHRRDTTPAVGQGVRLVRCAATGALYVHLLLPVALVADFVLHPDHLIGVLGGTLDRDDAPR
ncbi:hypothetical protein [Kitasatospora aureofaciens]|uniref:hypothetical protein n=1 Tax=Kitasatospora aureofaciens TaxID=1894 RepID=UPI0033D2702E